MRHDDLLDRLDALANPRVEEPAAPFLAAVARRRRARRLSFVLPLAAAAALAVALLPRPTPAPPAPPPGDLALASPPDSYAGLLREIGGLDSPPPPAAGLAARSDRPLRALDGLRVRASLLDF